MKRFIFISILLITCLVASHTDANAQAWHKYLSVATCTTDFGQTIGPGTMICQQDSGFVFIVQDSTYLKTEDVNSIRHEGQLKWLYIAPILHGADSNSTKYPIGAIICTNRKVWFKVAQNTWRSK